MTDKYNRAQRLHPEYKFNDEIDEMIQSEYKAAAKEIDTRLVEFLATPAAKERIEFFSRALLFIDSAEPEVRRYITSDRNVLKGLYDESVRLKREFERLEQEKRDKAAACEAESNVRSIIDRMYSADENDRSKLSRAKGYFTNLTNSQKAYFSAELLNKLESLIRDANEDYREKERRREEERRRREAEERRRREEEERRRREAEERRRRDEQRRQMTSSHHSSSTSHHSSRPSSHHGGHGGRPGGGGASRKF